MNYLALDFETTSLDAQNTLVTEVGAILFDDKFQELEVLSQLCHEEADPPLDPIIVELTGITDELLVAQGKPRFEVFANKLLPMVGKADVVFIHNVSFDQTILEATCKRLRLFLRDKEFICTLTNFNWPKKYKCFKLSHLGFDHGLDFRASGAHRALYDCKILVGLLALYKMEDVIAYAREPWIFVKGDVMAPWTDSAVPKQSDIAKKLGFQWEKIRYGHEMTEFPKTWVKRLKAGDLVRLQNEISITSSPFRISEIK